jgi:hypothetical protein
MKAPVAITALLCLFCNINPVRGGQTTNDLQIKQAIVSMQGRIVDLTDPLQPLYDEQFVSLRKSMSEKTARQVVELIRHGNLTATQADIGALLLSGLKEQTYWVVTESLLTTNTDEQILEDILSPPFPYGPGYANTYKIEYFRKRLLLLKTESPGSHFDSTFDLILSGEDSKDYADYLKHPHDYGY